MTYNKFKTYDFADLYELTCKSRCNMAEVLHPGDAQAMVYARKQIIKAGYFPICVKSLTGQVCWRLQSQQGFEIYGSRADETEKRDMITIVHSYFVWLKINDKL